MSDVESARYGCSLVFDDFDAFTSAAREWDLDFRQLDHGRFRGEMLLFGGGPVQLARARFNRALLQRGAPPSGHRTFVVPVHSSMRLRWRGLDVSGREILAFPLDGDLRSVSRPDFHIYTIAIQEEHLGRLAESLGLPVPSDLARGRETASIGPNELGRLRRLLGLIVRRLEDAGGDPDAPADAVSLRHLIEVEVPRQLLCAFAAEAAVRPPRTTSRHASLFAEAERFALANVHRVVGVHEVCAVVGRSDRTLRRAFREGYGIGPKQFLQALRLGEVRRVLRASSPAESQTGKIAIQHGFWHMGQFAADYRRQFGELPSSTLGSSRLAVPG